MDTNKDRRDYDRDANQQHSQNPDQQHRHQDRSGNFEDHNDRDRRDRQQDSNFDLRETERRWNDINTDYRKRYPNLTSEDVDYRQGEFEDMTDRIAKKTNRSRQEVQNEISNWNSDSYDRE